MNRENAKIWSDNANKDKQTECSEPNWSWDCGLKLDFDGGLLRVISRFYQSSNDIFDGSVSFYIGDTEIFRREFSSRRIDILKKDVEEYVTDVTANVENLCNNNVGVFVGAKRNA